MISLSGSIRIFLVKVLTVVVAILLHGYSAQAQTKFVELRRENSELFKALDTLNGNDQEAETQFCPDDKAIKAGAPAKTSGVLYGSKPGKTVMKAEGDLLRYFDCYISMNENVTNARMRTVRNKLMPLITSASNTFGIPKTLLACLIFRESKHFDPNAISSTGAIGYSQYTRSNMSYMSGVLKSMTKEEYEGHLATSKRTPEEQIKARANQIKPHVAKQEIVTAISKVRQYQLMVQWEAYFADLHGRKLSGPGIPRRLHAGNIKNPDIAIGAAAIYLQDILMTLKEDLDKNVKLRNADRSTADVDLLVAAAGLYNVGPGGVAKFLAPLNTSDRKKWIDALVKSNAETAGHILSIQRCIEATNSKSGLAWKPPIATQSRDCFSPDKKVLSDTPDKLPKELQNLFSTSGKKTAASATRPEAKETGQRKARAKVAKASSSKGGDSKAGATKAPTPKAAKKGGK